MPIYLKGPHPAGHATDCGQGRLWGQKHQSPVPSTPPPPAFPGPEQPEGLWREEGGEEGLAPS